MSEPGNATFKLSESRNAMNAIKRYAADDEHVILGILYDKTRGRQLRVTVIAMGLNSARKAAINLPILNQVAQVPASGNRQGGSGSVQPSY
jgi:cell division protein FtsZ